MSKIQCYPFRKVRWFPDFTSFWLPQVPFQKTHFQRTHLILVKIFRLNREHCQLKITSTETYETRLHIRMYHSTLVIGEACLAVRCSVFSAFQIVVMLEFMPSLLYTPAVFSLQESLISTHNLFTARFLLQLHFVLSCFGTLSGSSQGLFLTLSSGITLVRAWRTHYVILRCGSDMHKSSI